MKNKIRKERNRRKWNERDELEWRRIQILKNKSYHLTYFLNQKNFWFPNISKMRPICIITGRIYSVSQIYGLNRVLWKDFQSKGYLIGWKINV